MNENYGIFDLLRESWSLTKQILSKKIRMLLYFSVIVLACSVYLPMATKVSDGSVVFKNLGLVSCLLLLIIFSWGILNAGIYLEGGKLYGYATPKNCDSLWYLVKKALVFLGVSFVIFMGIVIPTSIIDNLITLGQPWLLILVCLSLLVYFCLLGLFKVISIPIFLLTNGNFFRSIISCFKEIGKKKLVVLSSGGLIIAINCGLILTVSGILFFLNPKMVRFIPNPLWIKIISSAITVIPVMLSFVLNDAYSVVLCKYLTRFKQK